MQSKVIYSDDYVLVEKRPDGSYLVDTPQRRVMCHTAEDALELLASELADVWGQMDEQEEGSSDYWAGFVCEWEAGWCR